MKDTKDSELLPFSSLNFVLLHNFRASRKILQKSKTLEIGYSPAKSPRR